MCCSAPVPSVHTSGHSAELFIYLKCVYSCIQETDLHFTPVIIKIKIMWAKRSILDCYKSFKTS